jgi:uncharacterized protein (DUF952 family)/catechol 2,3-dioxygenase-like lactoylglutathione lyase family enzyme
MKQILHITSLVEWEKAKVAGEYTAPSLKSAGFIHCSLAHQIPPVANYNFKGQQGLVILEIDENKLNHEVKYEDLMDEGELFPHIYGPLNLNAVLRVVPFPPEVDGTFNLPKALLKAAIVLRLNHADIIIPRGSEVLAREFYCDFLGFTEIAKPSNLLANGGLWLEVGNAQVHLSIQDGFDPSKTKSHLAYEVKDLEHLKSELSKRGIAWNDNSSVPGFIRGDIRDPFGNRIEFLQATR